MIRLLKQSDIEYLKTHSVSRGLFDKMPEVIDYVYTSEFRGEVLAVGGIKLVNLYTAWCWGDYTDKALEHGRIVARDTRTMHDTFAQSMGLSRMQTYVECDFERAIKFIEFCGFKREYRMPKFMGDKDAYMYVRLYDSTVSKKD